LKGFDRWPQNVLADEPYGSRIIKYVAHFFGFKQIIYRNDDAPDFGEGEKNFEPFRSVLRKDTDPVSLLEALCEKPNCEILGSGVQLFVRVLSLAEYECDTVSLCPM
jgi:hypothetical protein